LGHVNWALLFGRHDIPLLFGGRNWL